MGMRAGCAAVAAALWAGAAGAASLGADGFGSLGALTAESCAPGANDCAEGAPSSAALNPTAEDGRALRDDWRAPLREALETPATQGPGLLFEPPRGARD